MVPVPAHALGRREVRLAALTPSQRQLISEAVSAYESFGGMIDEFAEVTALRFLLWNDWKLSRATKQMRATAAWRRKSGANEIRRKMAAGMTFAEIPKAAQMVQAAAMAPNCTRSLAGDLLTLVDLGSLNCDKFFALLTDADFFTLNVHIFEHQTYHADRLTVATGRLVRNAMLVDAAGITLAHIAPRM